MLSADLMKTSHVAASVVAAFLVTACGAAPVSSDERGEKTGTVRSALEEDDELPIEVENPDKEGIVEVLHPGGLGWSTSDGTPKDQGLVAGETSVSAAGAGQICVIGTHGMPGSIQCLPPEDLYQNSGATYLHCSVCFAGSGTTLSGEGSVAQYLAEHQGASCGDVIACTGTTASRAGGAPGCRATVSCHGQFVNGCTPAVAISPVVPGVCFETLTNSAGPGILTGGPTASMIPAPNLDRVSVGCFPGQQPHDVWQRCRNNYRNYVTDPGYFFADRTCATEWAEAEPTPGFQTCNALVRKCIDSTNRACAAGGGGGAANP